LVQAAVEDVELQAWREERPKLGGGHGVREDEHVFEVSHDVERVALQSLQHRRASACPKNLVSGELFLLIAFFERRPDTVDRISVA
jgi:hypothetical protein